MTKATSSIYGLYTLYTSILLYIYEIGTFGTLRNVHIHLTCQTLINVPVIIVKRTELMTLVPLKAIASGTGIGICDKYVV